MAKKEPCVYGVKEPTNINQLNNAYMLAYIKANLADGSISKEQVAAFKKAKNAAIKKDDTAIEVSHKTRPAFAEAFMPQLMPKKKKSVDFDADLDKLLAD